jgi:tRNA/tmRNA/rRNA uracil-C5-methylase (TrmA/RlmC/RlmD family)
MDNIFDPKVFRKCHGWMNVVQESKLSPAHQEYFIIPPSEHLMPESVPKKSRCEGCELEFKRYQTLNRVKRYRIQKKQQEVLENYIKAYQANQRGDITLPQNIQKQLRRIIVESGGNISEE